MSLSIIIPTYNEKENILFLIKSIKKKFKNKNFEIIIVDDNSPDKLFKYLKNKKFKKVRIYKNIYEKSLAKSILYGLKKSSKKNILLMDSDFTHDPKYLKQFYNLISQHDYVVGSRFVPGGYMKNKFHFYCSKTFNIFAKIVLSTDINDNTSGFIMIKKKLFKLIPIEKIFYGYGDYFFRFLFYLNKETNNKKEIPVKYKNRFKGNSKTNFLKYLFIYLYEVIKTRIVFLFY
tara:strand:- start:1369 stop:2064 length:696 start_codon:yes stop_codon:yes gene_type:complete